MRRANESGSRRGQSSEVAGLGKEMVLTREDLELLKRLQAAGERGRTIPEFNTRITLQRLARGGYVIARAGLELVNYRITQRGKDAIIEHDLN